MNHFAEFSNKHPNNIGLGAKTLENLIIGLTICLFACPIIFDLFINGWRRVFFYFAADAFYYLTIAKNFAIHGFYTFDQENPTNGFHPLWQIILSFIYKIANALSLPEPIVLIIVLLINIVFICVSIWFLGKYLQAVYGRIPVTFTLLPVVYAVFVAPVEHQYGSLWSFANGMESSLAILTFSALIFTLAKSDFPNSGSLLAAGWVGVWLGLLFLSRLDYIFMTLSFVTVISYYITFNKQRRIIKLLFIPFGIVTALLVGYLVCNLIFVGTPFPVSGSLKSTFPRPILYNLKDGVSLLLSSSQPWFVERFWRHAQLNIPAIVATLFFLWRSKKNNFKGMFDRGDFIIQMNCLFIIFLWAYNFFFVPLWNQGHWYFSVSIFSISIFLIQSLDYLVFSGMRKLEEPGIKQTGPEYNKNSTSALPENNNLNIARCSPQLVLVCISGIIVILFFRLIFWNSTYNSHYAWLFDEADRIRKHYAGMTPKLLEYDDGIIAYSTGFPTMSGLGFALDNEAINYKKDGNLLSLAYSRGFTFVTSLNYFGANGLAYDSPSTIIQEKLGKTFFLTNKDISSFNFSVDYLSDNGNYAIIRVIPKTK